METALYYTLSTIAQTLARALAILVAVVLFKLAALSKAIETTKERLRNLGTDAGTTWPILRDKGLDVLAQTLAKDYGVQLSRDRFLYQEFEEARAGYHTWGRINFRLYTALAATVVDIAVCLVALPYTPRLVGCGWATHVIWTTVGLSILCLLLYVWLIVAMVRRPAD